MQPENNNATFLDYTYLSIFNSIQKHFIDGQVNKIKYQNMFY